MVVWNREFFFFFFWCVSGVLRWKSYRYFNSCFVMRRSYSYPLLLYLAIPNICRFSTRFFFFFRKVFSYERKTFERYKCSTVFKLDSAWETFSVTEISLSPMTVEYTRPKIFQSPRWLTLLVKNFLNFNLLVVPARKRNLSKIFFFFFFLKFFLMTFEIGLVGYGRYRSGTLYGVSEVYPMHFVSHDVHNVISKRFFLLKENFWNLAL